MNDRWRWKLRFYYNRDSGFRRSIFAIETVHADEFSRDMEIETGKRRSDIGRIEQFDLSTDPPTMRVIIEG